MSEAGSASEREQDMWAFENARTFEGASDVARAMVGLGRWGNVAAGRFEKVWRRRPIGVSNDE